MNKLLKAECLITINIGNTHLSMMLHHGQVLPKDQFQLPRELNIKRFKLSQDLMAYGYLKKLILKNVKAIGYCTTLALKDQQRIWPKVSQLIEFLKRNNRKNKIYIYSTSDQFKNSKFEDLKSHYSKTLGADRYLQCWALKSMTTETMATKTKKNMTALFDAGTMCTFDVLNQKGEHLGGPIFLGLGPWLNAMKEASLLKNVKPTLSLLNTRNLNTKNKLPSTTVEAILAGHFQSISHYVLGQCQNQKIKHLVISGGDSELWTNLLGPVKPKSLKITTSPHLVHLGLARLLKIKMKEIKNWQKKGIDS